VEIEFDPRKSRENRKKHGPSPAEAERLDWNAMIAWVDDSQDYGEDRWVGIAPLGEGSLHTVVFTEIDQERARIISLRPSTTQEIRTYAAQKGQE
jgi:uncharacterized DUF497 family protein